VNGSDRFSTHPSLGSLLVKAASGCLSVIVSENVPDCLVAWAALLGRCRVLRNYLLSLFAFRRCSTYRFTDVADLVYFAMTVHGYCYSTFPILDKYHCAVW
jgi:hypothetical protein